MGHLKQMYDKCFLHKHKIGACTLKQACSIYYFLRLAAVDPFLEYIGCWCIVVLRQTCKDFNELPQITRPCCLKGLIAYGAQDSCTSVHINPAILHPCRSTGDEIGYCRIAPALIGRKLVLVCDARQVIGRCELRFRDGHPFDKVAHAGYLRPIGKRHQLIEHARNERRRQTCRIDAPLSIKKLADLACKFGIVSHDDLIERCKYICIVFLWKPTKGAYTRQSCGTIVVQREPENDLLLFF